MQNYKDIVTSICGVIAALSVATAGADKAWPNYLPIWLVIAMYILGAGAVYYAANLIGKNPDGSTKTETQVTIQNKEAADTREIK
jgi:uncharacterized membrane protein